MPLVQLSKVKSQVNALDVHFNDPELFPDYLISLFQMYENKKVSTNSWLRKNSQLSFYYVPESVMAELESRIAVLSRMKPDSALINADILWEFPYYELKKTAIMLISNLDEGHEKYFFQRVQLWLSVDLEDILIKDLMATVESKSNFLQSKQWLDLIKTWLDSKDTNVVKLGLQAINRTLSHEYHNLPVVFSALAPLIHNPQLVIQKELINVIQALILLSEAETASFLIMVGELFPEKEVLKFIRKCLPLFDNFYQNEIRSALGAY